MNKAQGELEAATARKEGRGLNATEPLAFYAAGQKTAGYAWRFGLALDTALRDREHWEHQAAIDYMLYVCRVSGFRTEDYAAELPIEAEQAKRYWDSVYADAASRAMSDPMPTGTDIVAQDVAKFENMALQNVRSVVEDRRYARPQPAPPARSYMQPPATVREMGLR